MAAQLNVLSNSIGLRDTVNPTVMNTQGLGAASVNTEIDDYAAATAAGLGTAGSYYRIVRMPTNVKFKSVVIGSDAILDSSATASLQFDFTIAFSDSTIDGTPSTYQGLVPTTALGGATENITAHSAPNKIFGAAVTQPAANAIWAPTEYVLKGITSTFTIGLVTQQPLWQTFGFTDTAGNNQDPGGFWDLVVYVATVAGSAHAGNIWARVHYAK